jgi:hypothetical protein
LVGVIFLKLSRLLTWGIDIQDGPGAVPWMIRIYPFVMLLRVTVMVIIILLTPLLVNIYALEMFLLLIRQQFAQDNSFGRPASVIRMEGGARGQKVVHVMARP